MCQLLLCAFVGTEGSVKVVSAAKDNWVPQSREPVEAKDITEGLEIKIARRQEEDVKLDGGRSSQAAWILQYMEQQEEV
jgi:ATP-dependent RNA helicase DHX29